MLDHFQIGYGKSVTTYPAYGDEMAKNYKYMSDERVVVDGNLVTSQGPDTALEFGLRIVEILFEDSEKMNDIAKKLLVSF